MKEKEGNFKKVKVYVGGENGCFPRGQYKIKKDGLPSVERLSCDGEDPAIALTRGEFVEMRLNGTLRNYKEPKPEIER